MWLPVKRNKFFKFSLLKIIYCTRSEVKEQNKVVLTARTVKRIKILFKFKDNYQLYDYFDRRMPFVTQDDLKWPSYLFQCYQWRMSFRMRTFSIIQIIWNFFVDLEFFKNTLEYRNGSKIDRELIRPLNYYLNQNGSRVPSDNVGVNELSK